MTQPSLRPVPSRQATGEFERRDDNMIVTAPVQENHQETAGRRGPNHGRADKHGSQNPLIIRTLDQYKWDENRRRNLTRRNKLQIRVAGLLRNQEAVLLWTRMSLEVTMLTKALKAGRETCCFQTGHSQPAHR